MIIVHNTLVMWYNVIHLHSQYCFLQVFSKTCCNIKYFVPRKIFEPVNVLILSSWYEIFVQETAVNGQPNSASCTDGQTSIKSKQVV